MEELQKRLNELIEALKSLSVAMALYSIECEGQADYLKKHLGKEVEN